MTQSHTPDLEAIVLAAGRGERFGGDKLLADLAGAPLVAWALRTALAAPARRVLVAVGDDARLVAALTAEATRLKALERLELVPTPDAAEGMGASLRTVAAAVSGNVDGVFVFLGDMPAIQPETLARLAAALEGPDRIVFPVHNQRRGHPVLFGARWLSALRACRGDEGARKLIAEAGPGLIAVEADDPGVLLDVDRPDDLARIGPVIAADARDR